MAILGSVFGAVAAWGDHRFSAHGLHIRDQRIRIVSLVTHNRRSAQTLDQGPSLRNISNLTARQEPAHPP